MTPETKKRIHLIYGIAVSVVAVVAGICFIAACCNIYFTGVAEDLPQIYTRDIVSESFSKIAIPVYLCLALVLGGIVLDLALPREKKKRKAEKDLPALLRMQYQRTDLTAVDPALRSRMDAQKECRRLQIILSTFLLAVGSVVFLIYACTAGNWGANSTPSMVSAMYMMIGCLTVPLLYILYTAYFCRKSMEKELELVKEAAKRFPLAQNVSAAPAKAHRMGVVQLVMIAAAVALVILGVCNGGTADILTKAVNICTECVGLG